MKFKTTDYNSIGQYLNSSDSPTFGPIRIEPSAGRTQIALSKITGNHAVVSNGFDVLGQITFEIE